MSLNFTAAGEQRQKVQRLKQSIEETEKEVEQLLFQKEENIKSLEKGAADLQEQKQCKFERVFDRFFFFPGVGPYALSLLQVRCH